MSSKSIGKLMGMVMAGLMLASGASAQVGPGLRFLSDTNGLTVVGPAAGQFFRMRITGKEVGRLRTPKKYWFRADGLRFEFLSEENINFLPTDIPQRLDDRVVLELYRTQFLRANGNPKIRSKWVRLSSGMTALFWSYDKFVATPGPGNKSEREMFLIVAGPGHVFGLFAPVSRGGTEPETRRLLTRTLGTLTFLDEMEN